MEYGLVVLWLATYLALALAALPLAGALFGRLGTAGSAFAFPLSLAVLGLVGYLAGHVAFGWPAVLAGAVVLLGLSYLVADRVRVERRGYAEAALVFALAFCFLVAVRAVDPAVHPVGGEKFLDYGLLNTILRADALPPEDMWFAGEPVQYYYGGHALAALLATLTDTAPRFAYNLALAGFYATLVTAGYGLAASLGAAHGAPRRLAGGLGAFFVGLASNLSTPGRVVLWLLPDGAARAIGSAAGLPEETVAWTPAAFSYWDASRVIRTPNDFGIPTEFPLFSWLNGDLHGHMMAEPFLVLLAGLCYSYWLTPPDERWRRRALVFGAVPPVVGLLAIVSTWSFPTAVGLAWLTLALAPANPLTLLPDRLLERVPGGIPTGHRGTWAEADGGTAAARVTGGGRPTPTVGAWLREELAWTGTALVLAACVLALGALWVAPFWLVSASSRPIAFLPDRSSLGALLLVHGGFLLVFVPYLARRVAPELDRAWLVGAALAGILAATAALGAAAVGLFVPLLVAAWALVRLRRDVGFETLLVLGGAGVLLLVEFAYVNENAGPGRFNTVFKASVQVWLLWATAAGAALARMVTADASRVGAATERTATARRGVAVRLRAALPTFAGAARALAVVLVVSTSLYGAFALGQHFTGNTGYYAQFATVDDPTLDAEQFVREHHADEAPAIAWIGAREGKPNIVTAAPGGYFWRPAEGKGSSAPASLTGVPTVAGWFEERGYRSPEVYNARVADVETIYAGPADRQAALLARYDVEYVYVGPAERARYGEITVDRLSGVTVAERFEHVTIYRVDRERLEST